MEASIEPTATAETKIRLTMARRGAGDVPHSFLGNLRGVRGAVPARPVYGRNCLVYGESNGAAKDREEITPCLGTSGHSVGVVHGRRAMYRSIV